MKKSSLLVAVGMVCMSLLGGCNGIETHSEKSLTYNIDEFDGKVEITYPNGDFTLKKGQGKEAFRIISDDYEVKFSFFTKEMLEDGGLMEAFEDFESVKANGEGFTGRVALNHVDEEYEVLIMAQLEDTKDAYILGVVREADGDEDHYNRDEAEDAQKAARNALREMIVEFRD